MRKSKKESINPILENLNFYSGSGILEYNDVRYMLIRPETVIEIQKVLEEMFGVSIAHEILYGSGFKGTSLTANKLLKSGLSPDQCLQAMFEMGGYLGWGKFVLQEEAPGGISGHEVVIHASPFAKAYGTSQHPVCSILCGALAGIFSTLKEMLYLCSESECVAMGNPFCRFCLVPSEKLSTS